MPDFFIILGHYGSYCSMFPTTLTLSHDNQFCSYCIGCCIITCVLCILLLDGTFKTKHCCYYYNCSIDPSDVTWCDNCYCLWYCENCDSGSWNVLCVLSDIGIDCWR